MAITAGTLIDSVSRRVRDANNTAHSRTFVLDLIDRLQVILNAKQAYVFTDTVYTATKNKALYTVETDLGSTIEVHEVSSQGRELDEVNWRNLHRLSPTWLDDRSDTPLHWAKIGRDLVAIYPAPNWNVPITFTGSKITTPLTAETIQVELRDEDSDLLREMTTALLLTRQRDGIEVGSQILSRVADKMNLQMDYQAMRDDASMSD